MTDKKFGVKTYIAIFLYSLKKIQRFISYEWIYLFCDIDMILYDIIYTKIK